MSKQLLIGCGSRREKLVAWPGSEAWTDLVTLDINERHRPDVVHDLERLPLPFDSGAFDEVHAYEVLEHIGQQGDYLSFFALFSELWRILEPDGFVMATCPSASSRWAWGDPGHRRIISNESLVFLSQDQYSRQVGRTPMTDYRFCYRADFDTVHSRDDGATFSFALRAVKPSRI